MHNKTLNILLPTLLVSLLLSGCGSSESYKSEALYATDDVMNTAAEYDYDNGYYADEYYSESTEYREKTTDATQAADHGKKIVYTYDLNVQTKDFDSLVLSISSRIPEFGGYVENSYMDTYNDERSLSMTIRLPQEKAEDFLGFVGDNSNVLSRSESATDKTLEYVDIDARLKSYNQELDTLESLSKRASNVSELLEIENTIANVRGQRDSLQSQLNSIDNRVSFSTINLSVKEVVDYTYTDPSFIEKILTGWADSLEDIEDMISNFIIRIPVFLVGLILFLIPVTIAVLIIRFIIKVFFKKDTKKASKTEDNLPGNKSETTVESTANEDQNTSENLN